MSTQRIRLAGSSHDSTDAVRPLPPDQRLTVSVYVRRDPSAGLPVAVSEQARLAPSARTYLDRAEAGVRYGAAAADLDAVASFAVNHGLQVVERDAARRTVRLEGPVSAMNAAFGIELHECRDRDGRAFRGHADDVTLPVGLHTIVEGVLGLDNRRMARSNLRASHRQYAEHAAGTVKTALAADTYLPTDVARLYDFPAADGNGASLAVFAFNGSVMSTDESTKGGYDAAALDAYFTETIGQAAPALVDVIVQGPGNDPGDGSDPDDATPEVLLDLCIVGSVAPGAKIAVYFTEFTEEGWVNAVKHALADTANAPSILSISYGNPEDDSQHGLWTRVAVQLINDAFQQAAAQGITVCCASGDNGSGDEPNASTDHVDFPASSPWVLATGGTSLKADIATDTISSEVTWNDLAQGHGASGGGVSRLFAVPAWQSDAGVPKNADGSGSTGRGVPDVASIADPETPLWVLQADGSLGGIGGTSAAAPMWASLLARITGAGGVRPGFVNTLLYSTLHTALVDITGGGNGAYDAGPGWDACTGWGRPDGQKLLSAFDSAATAATTPRAPASDALLFADPVPGADETTFQVDNTSAAYYSSPYYLLHQYKLQPFPAPIRDPPQLDLADIVGAEALAPIVAANRIVFHAVGDTGAAKQRSIANEAGVADAMSAAASGAIGPDTPAFLLHLGDVIYEFGEAEYYYDQFYEPFRAYDRPIFAIPGNHDGSVYGTSTTTPQIPTLTAFLRNFCAASTGPSPDAGGAVRSAMTEPGVYFALDAPCVSIIGLYSNVLEGPGVISSENGVYPAITDDQLTFLTSQLTRLKPARDALQRAVILAVHHPPTSVDSKHGGTLGLSRDIDSCCGSAGLWPDLVLSGHAHLYQRFTRAVGSAQIPYVVSGSGGYGLTSPQQVKAQDTQNGFTLAATPIEQYGFLTVSVDLTVSPATLTVRFTSTSGSGRDSVTVDLSARKIAAAS